MGDVYTLLSVVSVGYFAIGAVFAVVNVIVWRGALNFWRGVGLALTWLFLWPEPFLRGRF